MHDWYSPFSPLTGKVHFDFERLLLYIYIGKALKGCSIWDHECRALYGNQVPNFEITQRARNRLTSCANEFRDFLVGQGQFDPCPPLRLLYPGGQSQQEPGAFLMRGGGKTNRSELFAGALVLRTHLSYHVSKGFR